MIKIKKKRTKKNNPIKRATVMATYGTSDLLLVFVGGIKETHALDKKTGTPVSIGKSIESSLHAIAFKWHVYLAVLCRSQSGEEYIQSEEMNFVHPYRRNLLSDRLNEQHDKLIRTCNPSHILNIGWIASTVPYDFDDAYCCKLIEQQGAWGYLAEWQKEKVIKETPLLPKCIKCKRFTTKDEYREHGHFGRPCKKCRGELS